MAENRMQDIFDKIYESNEDYSDRFAKEIQSLAKITKTVARLVVISSIMFIGACTLVLSSCIKYLFFNG
tara:strand:- start:360 stop:566 length:207 start_codon:yes stop_codon:yes gene_type:complete